MKKTHRLISAALLCAMLLSSALMLASCSPEKALEIWAKLEKNMDGLTSYKSDVRIEMTLYAEDKKITGTSEGFQIEAGRDNPADYYFMQSMTTTVKAEDADVDKTVHATEAYYDGKHFITHAEDDDEPHRIYGESTVEDFLEYMASMPTASLDLTESRSFEKKGKTLTFSEFPKTVISRLAKSFGADASTLGAEINDLSVTVEYNAKYLVTAMEYKFSFGPNDSWKFPELFVRVSYSDHNSAERVQESTPLSEYTKLEHFDVIRNVGVELEKMKIATGERFHVNINQTVKIDNKHSSYSESEYVSYGEESGSGRFHYEIESKILGQDVEISYYGGKQTVESKDKKEEVDQTEEEARAFIEGLITISSFNLRNVASIKQIESSADGEEFTDVYLVELGDFDYTSYQPLASKLGLSSYENLTHTMTVQYVDGALRYISSSIKFENRAESEVYFTLNVSQLFILSGDAKK